MLRRITLLAAVCLPIAGATVLIMVAATTRFDIFRPARVSGAAPKVLVSDRVADTAPVEVLEIRSGGLPITHGKPFDAPPGSLETLTIRARNVSGQPIHTVGFDVMMIDGSGNAYLDMVWSWPVAPGEEFTVTPVPGAQRLPTWYTTSKATIRLAEVRFTEVRRWRYGLYHKPNPANPDEWLPEERPGGLMLIDGQL